MVIKSVFFHTLDVFSNQNYLFQSFLINEKHQITLYEWMV